MSIKKSLLGSYEKNEIKWRILEEFPILNDAKKQHLYYSSYDFHPNEEAMILFWKEVLMNIFEKEQNISLKFVKIKEMCKIGSRLPLGLVNILIRLQRDNYFILEKILLSNVKIEEIYPNIRKRKSMLNRIKSYFSSFLFKEPNDEIVIEDIKPDDNIIFFEAFEENLKIILNILHTLFIEMDLNVITKHELNKIILKEGVLFK
jgi:hypothetical protein